MKITLDQNEIEQALVSFVSNQGICIADKKIMVTLLAGKELTAAIEISHGISKPASPVVQRPPEPAPVFGTPEIPQPTAAAVTPPIHEEEEDGGQDREAIKAELDKLGIAYQPKARTATLIALLEEAKAGKPSPTVSEAEEGPMFGQTETEPAVPQEGPAAPAQSAPVDDDLPLFGSAAAPPAQPEAAKKEDTAPPFDLDTAEEEKPLFGS